MRKTWIEINQVMNRKQSPNPIDALALDQSITTNAFNQHFVSVGSGQERTTPYSHKYMRSVENGVSFRFQCVSYDDVQSAILAVDSSAAAGYDDIKAGPILQTKHFLIQPLKHINLCIHSNC